MATSGSKINVTIFNNLVSGINNIVGTGSGQTGYGQTLNANTSTVSTASKITSARWNAVRDDLRRIAEHQGTLASVTLPTVATGVKISAATTTNYENALVTLSSATNIYKIAAGQYSDELLVPLADSTRSTSWNRTIRHYFTVDFGSADAARYFFNSGGNIRFNPVFTPSGSTAINNDWNTLINGIGEVYFDYTGTYITNSVGTGSSIGYYDLTVTPTQIYTRTGGSQLSTYAVNDYTVRAYCNVSNNVSGTARYVYFEVTFNDDKFNTTWGSDMSIVGNLVNNVRMYRPSGPNVAVSVPSVSVTVRLDAAQI